MKIYQITGQCLCVGLPIFGVACLMLLAGCVGTRRRMILGMMFALPSLWNAASHAEGVPTSITGKKVLYINAYHAGYAWSDSEQKALEDVLKKPGVDYRVVFMDSKNRNTAEEIEAAAADAKKTIEEFKPDVVIVSDDNPVKHVIVPWYKDTPLPFVFCGVNWNCSAYGLPCKNVTGMLEISLIPQMMETVKPLAKGSRVAILGNDNETDHKEGEMIPKRFGLQWTAERYVKTFDECKAAYKELQGCADIIFWYGTVGIKGWNDEEARAFVLENTTSVTCSTQYYMAPLVLVGFMKSGEEQGDWAAHRAMDILQGKSPAEIPVKENKIARKTLNMGLAKKMGIVFPVDLVKHAELVVK